MWLGRANWANAAARARSRRSRLLDRTRIRQLLKLEPDGTVTDTEVLDHARMNKPGQNFYKILAESALRAIRMCTPLKVPSSGYERWKEIQMNFDAREMLGG